MKPDAPAEIRGEFRPIATSLPGLSICEHLPRTVAVDAPRQPDSHGHAQLQRAQSAGHDDRLHRRRQRPDTRPRTPIRRISARSASTWAWADRRRARRGLHAVLSGLGRGDSPARPLRRLSWAGSTIRSSRLCKPTFDRAPRVPNYDPVRPIGEPLMPSLDALPDMTVDRLDAPALAARPARRSVSRAGTASRAIDTMSKHGQQAFSLLSSSKTREAFDLSQEPDARARPLRPQPERFEPADGPAAGRGGRHVRQRARRDLRQQRPLVRHARKQFRHAQGRQPADSRHGLSGPDSGSGRTRVCSIRRWWS